MSIQPVTTWTCVKEFVKKKKTFSLDVACQSSSYESLWNEIGLVIPQA